MPGGERGIQARIRREASMIAHPHPFVADPDLPADHRGRRVCAACHLIGRPDDPRHAMPDVPGQAEHRRRVGEDEG
jgi:hypothetical protein